MAVDMKTIKPVHYGFARLKLLLVLSTITLVFQLYPRLWTEVEWAADIRNWPRTIWFLANWIVVFALVVIRFGPDLYVAWCDRRKRLAVERGKRRKQQELKEQRETLERLKRGRERRIY